MRFFQKLSFSFFDGNFRTFLQKFSTALLDKLDLKIFIKNMWRFIAFDLIFHLACLLKSFVQAKSFKIYAEIFFMIIFALLGNSNFEQGHIFGDFNFIIEVKVALEYI